MDLWAGFSGAVIALLSLGLRVIAVAAESNKDARDVAASNFPGLVHVEWVEEVTAADASALLKRRSVTAIIVGGGSPCQANSILNRKRKGLDDPRSCQPTELRRIFDELCALPEVSSASITVLAWLENVASASLDTKEQYDEWLGASRVRIDAKCFGWISRNRCFWGRSQWKTLHQATFNKVSDTVMDWSDEREPTLSYVGKKPIPKVIDMEDGFALKVNPKHVMASGQGAMFPLTREFKHPLDSGVQNRVSPDALDRWNRDGRRFPPAAYELEPFDID